MNAQQSRSRPGFTLVELLTVIAIITLLIGILIPALSSARTQAKKASTRGLLKSLDSGCEMFHGDFQRYPQSRGPNPFETDPGVLLMGAQWLALQLMGADSRGFVEPTIKNDSNNDGVIDDQDWLDWYALNPTREYTRMGPYADVDAKALRSLVTYLNENPEIPDPSLDPTNMPVGNSEWDNARIPFFVDAFGYPVLYYAATPKVDAPFTTDTPAGDFVVGRYDQADNGYFTGSFGQDGRFPVQSPGWDLTGAGLMVFPAHPLGAFGYVEGQTEFPQPKTFAAFVCDQNIFENTERNGQGRLWPYKPDTFLLISTGADGVYGNGDDVTNFGAGN